MTGIWVRMPTMPLFETLCGNGSIPHVTLEHQFAGFGRRRPDGSRISQQGQERKRDGYYAGKKDYLPVFCFEGLITEFVEITYRFPSLRASFSSQVKNV